MCVFLLKAFVISSKAAIPGRTFNCKYNLQYQKLLFGKSFALKFDFIYNRLLRTLKILLILISISG